MEEVKLRKVDRMKERPVLFRRRTLADAVYTDKRHKGFCSFERVINAAHTKLQHPTHYH